jgi:hypothetical protein
MAPKDRALPLGTLFTILSANVKQAVLLVLVKA